MYAKIHLFDIDRESASGHTEYKSAPDTQIAIVNLVTLFAKAHPLICINDKFSNELVKILHKSVDSFKRYSKNQYLGHLDLLFKNWSESF